MIIVVVSITLKGNLNKNKIRILILMFVSIALKGNLNKNKKVWREIVKNRKEKIQIKQTMNGLSIFSSQMNMFAWGIMKREGEEEKSKTKK